MSSGSAVEKQSGGGLFGGTVVMIENVQCLHDQCALSATSVMASVASIVALAATFLCMHGADLARVIRIGKGEAVV